MHMRALRQTARMPLYARLRARIAHSARYSTSAEHDAAGASSSAAAKSSNDEVLFTVNGAVRSATLNRPAKLNALNENMCDLLKPRLQEYSKSDLVGSVLLKGAGGKALSAGGDVVVLAQRAIEEGAEASVEKNSAYFRDEFSLNHLIATYKKPFVSFLNGYVMGGGVGLSAHGSFRVATENTVVSMPETKIGYFPDVGSLFFLSRLNGQLGLFAALTSFRMSGYDAYRHGFASHYVNAELLPQVEQRLSELDTGSVTAEEYFTLVDESISEFASEPPAAYKPALSSVDLQLIDECFHFNSVEQIIDALRSQASRSPDFVADTLSALNERNPLSLKVTLKAYRNAAKLDFKSVIEQDMTLAHNFCLNKNFVEGITALLIDKRKPKWQPASLQDVSEELVSSFFQPAPDSRPVEFVNNETFDQYPHHFGLPSEQAVMDFVTGETSQQETKATRNDVLRHFQEKYPNGDKLGLKVYLNELLDRRTTPDKDDSTLLDWNY